MGKANFNFDLLNTNFPEGEIIADHAAFYLAADIVRTKYNYPETRANWIVISQIRLRNLNMTLQRFLAEDNSLNSLVPSIKTLLEISQPKTFDNNSAVPVRIIDYIRRNFDRVFTMKIIDILKEFEAQSES